MLVTSFSNEVWGVGPPHSSYASYSEESIVRSMGFGRLLFQQRPAETVYRHLHPPAKKQLTGFFICLLFFLRTFNGVETAALTFRTKQYCTSYSSHICYGKRFYNDFFLNHHTIALVNNFLKLLNCVVIETVLDLVKKESIILTVCFQLENVPF